MREPLQLNPRQRLLIERAAGAFRGAARDQFLERVNRSLFGEPSDLAVSIAVNCAFNYRG
jgi:hypothetical protein